MNIVVLVKQVPNTTEVRIDPKTGNLIREGVESIINPEDRHALEAALSIKEIVRRQGDGLDHGAATSDRGRVRSYCHGC